MGDDGAPLGDYVVALTTAESPPPGTVAFPRQEQAHSDGTSFRFVGLPPGVYTVEATAEGRNAGASDPIVLTAGLSVSKVRILVPEDEPAEGATEVEGAGLDGESSGE